MFETSIQGRDAGAPWAILGASLFFLLLILVGYFWVA
jgi:hypothetical protein